jgi:hypothetical protein
LYGIGFSSVTLWYGDHFMDKSTYVNIIKVVNKQDEDILQNSLKKKKLFKDQSNNAYANICMELDFLVLLCGMVIILWTNQQTV